MIEDSQALERIREAVGFYLQRAISHGEAMDDVVRALEASGRDPSRLLKRSGEARSWAPTGVGRASSSSERAGPSRRSTDADLHL